MVPSDSHAQMNAEISKYPCQMGRPQNNAPVAIGERVLGTADSASDGNGSELVLPVSEMRGHQASAKG